MQLDLTIRPVQAQDVDGILTIYNPIIATSPITYEEVQLSPQDMLARIEKVTKNHPWLVAVDGSGVVAGYAYAGQHRERAAYRWCVDVAVYVNENYRGQKVGQKLYLRLFEILKTQNYVQAYAGINLPNPASVALHESVGFKYIGTYNQTGFKLGQWHDAGWWRKEIMAPPAKPEEPIPYSKLTSKT